MIQGTDRVADVIGRDPTLIDVFAAAAPAFERLRNPALRRVMARLVTVEQAARIAGIDAGDLVARLNRGSAPSGPSEEVERNMDTLSTTTNPRPAALDGVDPDRIVDLDVRDDLRSGREPFSRIMAARKELPEDGVLRLRAIFEPVPLYGVFGKQGFLHWTERLGGDDWRIWFYRDEGSEALASADVGHEGGCAGGCPGAPAAEASSDDAVVVLDVRGLEPPEPMVRTLSALETLPRGHTLVQINVKEPRFLLPQLEERGFTWEVREQEPGLVRVFIRHAGD